MSHSNGLSHPMDTTFLEWKEKYTIHNIHLLTPKCPKSFFEVHVGHYSKSFDAKVLKLLVVIGHFITYMGI